MVIGGARNPGRSRPHDFLGPKGPKIVVVGNGILGNMISAELADLRPSPQIVTVAADEGTRPRASDGSLTWLNVVSAETDAYARLRVASMKLWQAIGNEDYCPVRFRGTLLWDRDRAALENLAAFQNGVGWDVGIVEREQFQALAPGVADAPDAALYAPYEGAAFPQWMMNWAETGPDVEAVVQSILVKGGRATGVRLDTGEMISADHVVLAAGVGSAQILGSISVDLPMKDAPGMCLWTEPLPPIAGPVLASPGMDFWQDDDGMILIATGTHDTMVDDLDGTVSASIERLKGLVPAARDVKVRGSMIRHRPIPLDGLPALGSPAGIDNLHVAVCHSGMTLAPIIAKVVGAAVAGQDPPIDLAPFHMDRFAKGQT